MATRTKQSKRIKGDVVRKETVYLVAMLALAVGFFGGVMFGVYKSDSRIPGQPASTVPPDTSDRSNTIAALEKEGGLSFQGEEALAEMRAGSVAWKQGFEQMQQMRLSIYWRADTEYLNTRIKPVQATRRIFRLTRHRPTVNFPGKISMLLKRLAANTCLGFGQK